MIRSKSFETQEVRGIHVCYYLAPGYVECYEVIDFVLY